MMMNKDDSMLKANVTRTDRDHDWDDWRWNQNNSITLLSQLDEYLNLSDEERDVFGRVGEKYVFRVTPYYLSLMDKKRSQLSSSPAAAAKLGRAQRCV